MAVYTGNVLGTEICRIMGINPDHVASLYLDCKPQSAAVLTVRLFIDTKDSEELLSALKKYELKLSNQDPQEAKCPTIG